MNWAEESEKPPSFLTKTENQRLNCRKPANRTRHQNRKTAILRAKTEKPNQKLATSAKPKTPMPPSINCSVTDEAFTGWFDSSGRKITSDSSKRIHVRADGSLKYLEISKVNSTDRGNYECRGKTNKEQVLLFVECMYHKRGRMLPNQCARSDWSISRGLLCQ